MLKKAQRDCGQSVRATSATLSQAIEIELDNAFRNFTSAVLRKEVSMCSVREEYLTMEPRELMVLLLTKLRNLLQMVNRIQIAWDPVNTGKTVKLAEKRKITRTLDLLNNVVVHFSTDDLFQKLFQVINLFICCGDKFDVIAALCRYCRLFRRNAIAFRTIGIG